MEMIFNKGKEDEKRIEVSNLSEHLTDGRLFGSREIVVSKAEDFPNVQDFVRDAFFETLEIVDGEMTVPMQGRYNVIENASVRYNSSDKNYYLNIQVGFKA